MVPASPATLEDGTRSWWQDYRGNYPDTFAITEPPGVLVRSPGEWEEKQSLLIAWTGNFGEVVANIIRYARLNTEVTIAHDGDYALSQFKLEMQRNGVDVSGLNYEQLPVQSLWMRDYGPLSIEADGILSFVDLRYYPGRLYDDAFPELLANKWGLNNFRMPFDFEGGNFISDGDGTCYLTTTVFERNPGSTEAQIRSYLDRYLGCSQSVFLEPLYGEGTGHIDMFAKLANRQTMVIGEYRASDSAPGVGAVDPVNAAILEQNIAKLESVILKDGSRLTIQRIPMPSHSDGHFRTYVNTQLINGVNLIPIYRDDDRYEANALAAWEAAMPTWQHIPVDATELITWAGAIHCILMEVGRESVHLFSQHRRRSAPTSAVLRPPWLH